MTPGTCETILSSGDGTGHRMLEDIFGADVFVNATRCEATGRFFLEYYKSRCQDFLIGGQNDVCVYTREEIKTIARMIMSDACRDEILSHVKAVYGNSVPDRTANTTLDFCASLLIM